jgi:hypothetical protein
VQIRVDNQAPVTEYLWKIYQQECQVAGTVILPVFASLLGNQRYQPWCKKVNILKEEFDTFYLKL